MAKETPGKTKRQLLLEEMRNVEKRVRLASAEFTRINKKRIALRKKNLGPDTLERITIIARYESARRELTRAKAQLRELQSRLKPRRPKD